MRRTQRGKLTLSKLIPLVLLVFAILFAIFNLVGAAPAQAGETGDGAKIFSSICASCHIGGGNIIIAHKTLKMPALEKFNMNSLEAIIYQVENGKNAMPAFKGRLTKQEIENVSAYVLEKAENGW